MKYRWYEEWIMPARASEDNNLAIHFPEVAKQWHPTKNGDIKPTQVTKSSTLKAWWLCEIGHAWEKQVKRRTSAFTRYFAISKIPIDPEDSRNNRILFNSFT